MQRKPRVCVDLDNVLGQTDKVMREIIRVASVSKKCPNGVRYQYSDVVHFHYPLCTDAEGLSVSDEVWNAVHQIFQDPNSGYVDLIEPMEGARQGLLVLAEDWDIWIVTSRHDGGLTKARAWVETHFASFGGTVHATGGKPKPGVTDFSAAIDDHLKTAIAFNNAGVRSFVYDQPWTRDASRHNGLTVVHNWDEFVTNLGTLSQQVRL